jgi:hypothetical protein
MPAAPRFRSPSAALRALVRLQLQFGSEPSAAKRRLLRALERGVLPHPSEVLRLHDLLCLWRAYPDDRALLAQVERMLKGFAARSDLRRHAPRLADSGIAGTEIHFRFFAPTAFWLARRWPARLTIDWAHFDQAGRLAEWLALLAHGGEVPALDEYDLPARDWIRRMSGPRTTDAAFLARRFAQLPLGDAAREVLYDELDVPLTLAPGAGTPSRTHARIPPAANPRRRGGRAAARGRFAGVAFQRGPLSRERPSPQAILELEPRSVRAVPEREAGRLIDLARAAMATRSRDLDVFSYGDPRDVRMVDFGGGLQFACIGALPERRLVLEAVYGYLTLKNGVPIGYVLTSALFGSSELAYNVFDTWRGAEAGFIYGRVLAMTRTLFGSDTFTIFPYQLGDGNEEAIDSGAWWFYHKMGFQPRQRAARALMNHELARMRRDPGHRSGPGTLRRLARHNVYLHLGPARQDIIGELPLPNAGLQVMHYLGERFGADRKRASRVCASEAAARLGVASPAHWSAAERRAWERWAPLVLLLPGLERWSADERRALAEVVRAKGGLRESEFVRRFDGHAKLRRALRSVLARPTG